MPGRVERLAAHEWQWTCGGEPNDRTQVVRKDADAELMQTVTENKFPPLGL